MTGRQETPKKHVLEQGLSGCFTLWLAGGRTYEQVENILVRPIYASLPFDQQVLLIHFVKNLPRSLCFNRRHQGQAPRSCCHPSKGAERLSSPPTSQRLQSPFQASDMLLSLGTVILNIYI